MKKSFIKVPREFFDTTLWSEKRKFSKADALLDILQHTDYKDGHIDTSYRRLADRWQWNIAAVQRFIRYLTQEGYITASPSRSGMIIKKYDDTPSDTPNDTPNDTPKVLKTNTLGDTRDTPNDTPSDTPSNTPQESALYVQARAYKNDILLNHSKEENNKKEKYKKKFGNHDFSFISDSMDEVYFEWLSYRKEIGKPFASDRSLRMNYERLMKLSNASPDMAKAIVRQSIANGYQGLFELRQSQTFGGSQVLHDNSQDKYKNDITWTK